MMRQIKRKAVRIITVVMAVSCLLTLTACGNSASSVASTSVYEPFVEEDPEIRYHEYSEELSNVSFTSHKSYNLWRNGDYLPYVGEERTVPTITAYLVERQTPAGCVLIFPGGGYAMRSNAEGEDIARYINETMQMSAFVVNYRLAPNNYRAILSDALRAIRFVRFYADDFQIEPDRIAVIGFSAGGHLALMTAEHYDYGKEGDNIDAVSSRPDAVALCYPVVTMAGEFAHEESRVNFLGGDDTEANRQKFSGELGIRSDMPPIFLIHCEDDDVVPIQNSYDLADELEKSEISCTCYWYQEGGHGFGLGDDAQPCSEWKVNFQTWLQERGIAQ